VFVSVNGLFLSCLILSLVSDSDAEIELDCISNSRYYIP
jgi:hypothetical protein